MSWVTCGDPGLRLFPRVKGTGVVPYPVSTSSASPPQGELNGQRGLVPSNFLESPGPEADGLESGTSQAESQVSEELGYQLIISSLPCWVFWDRDAMAGDSQRLSP